MRPQRKSIGAAGLSFVLLAHIAGCASLDGGPPPTSKLAVFNQEVAEIAVIAEDNDRAPNELDHKLRLASMAMDLGEGHREYARELLVEVTDTIASSHNHTEFQRRTDGTSSTITAKDKNYFLADPYEQMFAYFYLGLLDFREGEYELARSSFRNATRADEAKLDTGVPSDAYLMYLMEGVTSAILNEPEIANDAFRLADSAFRFRQRLPVVTSTLYRGVGAMVSENAKPGELKILDALFPVLYALVPEIVWTEPDPTAALTTAFARVRDLLRRETDEFADDSLEKALLEALRGRDKLALANDLLNRFESAALTQDISTRLRAIEREEQSFARLLEQCQSGSANTFLLIEQGSGPIKVQGGEYGELVRFWSAPDPVHKVIITITDKATGQLVMGGPTLQGEATDFQATTRDGRGMDSILEGNAQFRDTVFSRDYPYGPVGDRSQ